VSEQTVSEQHAWDLNGGELDRVLSQRMLLVYLLGDILGTGIYALVGEVAAEVEGRYGRPLHWPLPSRSSPRLLTRSS